MKEFPEALIKAVECDPGLRVAFCENCGSKMVRPISRLETWVFPLGMARYGTPRYKQTRYWCSVCDSVTDFHWELCRGSYSTCRVIPQGEK